MLERGEVRLRLLEVLECRVLILADLLNRGDLAEESIGVGGNEELGGGVETSVLELSQRGLADLKLQLCDLVGLGFDVSLLQLQLCTPLLDFFLDAGVLLVDSSRICLQLFNHRPRFCRGERWVRRCRQAGREDE